MATTKRCPLCGKVMKEKTFGDGSMALQCPRCLYTEPLPQSTKEAPSE